MRPFRNMLEAVRLLLSQCESYNGFDARHRHCEAPEGDEHERSSIIWTNRTPTTAVSEHEPTYSAQVMAAEEHENGRYVAKPVIVKSEGNSSCACSPHRTKWSLTSSGTTWARDDVMLATEEEIRESFPIAKKGLNRRSGGCMACGRSWTGPRRRRPHRLPGGLSRQGHSYEHGGLPCPGPAGDRRFRLSPGAGLPDPSSACGRRSCMPIGMIPGRQRSELVTAGRIDDGSALRRTLPSRGASLSSKPRAAAVRADRTSTS